MKKEVPMPCMDPFPQASYADRHFEEVCNLLCGLVTRVEKKNLHELVEADPALVAWWEAHKAEDNKRKAAEAASAERERLAKKALKKLTKKEKEVLGIREED